ncbi:hypothetical protein CR513_19027, partial [Mucuna pruriens]
MEKRGKLPMQETLSTFPKLKSLQQRFLQVRGIYIRCVVASFHVPYCLFPLRVVSELSSLKGVLLVRIMEGNTNRMKPESMFNEEWDFEHQQFKECTSLSNHLIEFQGIIDLMSGMGINFEDEIFGLLLLNSLPESWETFKVSITNSAPNGVVSLQMEREKSRSKSKSRYKNVECHYGHKTRYIEKHCFLWKKENKGKKGKSKENDDDDNDDDRVNTTIGDDLVVLRDFELVNFVSNESMWIIDSSATLHVTPRKEFFISYTLGDFVVLKMGNDGVTKVIGVGDVCLQTNIGMQLWLKGVKHALDVRFNLISVHMLDDGGYDNHFGHGKWKLTKGNLVVARGEKISKLYWTKALVAKDSVNAIDMEASLWNRRLSHISEKGLNCLAKKDRIEECKVGEMFSLHGWKIWVYVLKTKDQVLEKFKQFQALDIRHEKTPPKTPQLNGLVERTNRTLIERVSCKASVHVPKDERSKLDMKIRMYDPIEKKLVRSHDVQFMEDQNIKDIDKVKKSTLEEDNSLSEIDLVWMPIHDLDTVDNNVQNGEQHNYSDQQLGDDFDVPLDDDAEEEQEMLQDENLGNAPKLPLVQLRGLIDRDNHLQGSTHVVLHLDRSDLDLEQKRN